MMEEVVARPGGLTSDYLPAVTPAHKRPLVLLHGWGNTRQTWQRLIPLLVAERDVYNLDLPGFGDNAHCQMADLDDAVAAIEVLLPDNCVLLGWSLGGNLALRLAARFPRKIAAVITLATNVSFVANSRWPHAMPRATFDEFSRQFAEAPAVTLKRFCGLQAQGDVERKALLKQLREQSVAPSAQHSGQWQTALAWLEQLNHENEINHLSVPLLHMFGEEDALVPVAAARALSKVSHGQLGIISGAGHAPHLSCTSVVADHIREFLSSVFAEQEAAKLTQLDKQQVAESFSRAAATYDAAAHVQNLVGENLLLSTSELVPGAEILDLGCGTGFCTEFLQQQQARVTALDIAPGMLQQAQKKLTGDIRWVCGDAEQLPFAREKFSGVVSNLTIQWSENLPSLFNDLHKSLQRDGWLLFSTLGPDTLKELRAAWREVDGYTHVNQFVSAEFLRAAVSEAGLQVEMFREEEIVPRYSHLNSLMRELKSLGAHNVNRSRNHGLTGRHYLNALNEAYEKYRGADGQLPATYQVFYLLARK